jgi:hypothetical protein
VAKPIVQVLGMSALRRDIMRLDKEGMPRAMIEAGMLVSEPVANTVRAVLPSKSGALRGSVRVAKIRTGAAIRVGNARVSYTGPVEFGGYPGERPFIRDGRYIFPTARRMASSLVPAYEREIQRIINSNGWETSPNAP